VSRATIIFVLAFTVFISACKQEYKSFEELNIDKSALSGTWEQINPYPGASPNVLVIEVVDSRLKGNGSNDNAEYNFSGAMTSNPFGVSFESKARMQDSFLEFTFENSEKREIAVIAADTLRFFWSGDSYMDLVKRAAQ
jgi:hypothetical protein